MAVRRGEEENGREGKRERKSGAGTGEGQQCACVGREDGVVEGCPPRRGKKGEKKKIKEEWGIRSKEWGCPFCFIIITLLKIRLRMRYPSKPTNG
jgi:hypothetical protein